MKYTFSAFQIFIPGTYLDHLFAFHEKVDSPPPIISSSNMKCLILPINHQSYLPSSPNSKLRIQLYVCRNHNWFLYPYHCFVFSTAAHYRILQLFILSRALLFAMSFPKLSEFFSYPPSKFIDFGVVSHSGYSVLFETSIASAFFLTLLQAGVSK